jgi:hypothetical protein
MWVKVKSLSKRYSIWQERKNHQSFLLIKSILCVVTDLMGKTKLQEELKHSFLCKCKELDMMILEF